MKMEKLQQEVKKRGEFEKFLKDNGLKELDHVAQNELILRLIRDNYGKEVQNYNRRDSGKQNELKVYIEDFENQLFNVKTAAKDGTVSKTNKTKIKRLL